MPDKYDLVTAFECIHDMANPVEALGTMRRLAGEGGTVLVMDDKVADQFEVPGSAGRSISLRFQHSPLPAGRDG